MTKKQFLKELEETLKGELPENEIRANIEYYNDYITEGASRGKTEEEVFEELGSPQWIAGTIITSYKADRNFGQNEYNETSYWNTENSFYGEDKQEARRRKQMEKFSEYVVNGFPWYYKAAGILLTFIAIILAFYVGTFILKVAVGLIVPLLIIYLIWKVFFGRQ